MGECGLLNQIELNLTAETGEHLSIVDSMTDSEHIFGIPDELNFHYDIPSHTPQLLPLAKWNDFSFLKKKKNYNLKNKKKKKK